MDRRIAHPPSMLPVAELNALLRQTPEARDDAWMTRFCHVVLDTGLIVGDPPVIDGPDRFRYYQMRLPQPGDRGPWQTLRAVLPWCTDNGTGCAVMNLDQPAYIFYYGDLWSMRETGLMYQPGDPSQVGEPTDFVLTVTPTAEELPPYVRRVLRDYLQGIGIARPEVVMAIRRGESPEKGLGFNVSAEHFPSNAAYDDAMDSLRWHIRRDLGVVDDGSRLPGLTPL